MKVRFAVAPAVSTPGEFDPVAYAELLDGLEARGFDTVWLSDVPLAATVEPLVGLSFAAARTRRLKLGANLVPLGRNPFQLAKQLAQLDQLSGGRLLLTLVPGLGQPTERRALGLRALDRGALLEETIGLLRRLWSGEAVEHHSALADLDGVVCRPLPLQQPIELWLGGRAAKALERAGRLSDGWLGADLTPAEAGAARRTIERAATAAGRIVDPEHFGLSLPYARRDPAPEQLAQMAARRPDVDPSQLLPVGRQALRQLIGALVEEGLSKFVLRPAAPLDPGADELDWLAGAVLDLQS